MNSGREGPHPLPPLPPLRRTSGVDDDVPRLLALPGERDSPVVTLHLRGQPRQGQRPLQDVRPGGDPELLLQFVDEVERLALDG